MTGVGPGSAGVTGGRQEMKRRETDKTDEPAARGSLGQVARAGARLHRLPVCLVFLLSAAARARFSAAVGAGPLERGACVRQRSGIPSGTTPVVGSAATFRISGYPDCRCHQLGAVTARPGRGVSARSQE